MRRSFAVAGLLIVAGSPVLAQAPTILTPGARVRISAPRLRARDLTGTLLRVERDSIWVRTAHQDSAWTRDTRGVSVLAPIGMPHDTNWVAPVDALTRLEVSHGPRDRPSAMLRGAARGILYLGGAGMVLGLFIRDPEEFLYEDAAGGALFWGAFLGTFGAVGGAIVGLVAPGERWERVPLPLRRL